MDKIYKPWINAYDENCKDTISYFEGSYSAMVEDAASKYPNVIAYEFMGKKVKYKDFKKEIYQASLALTYLGIRQGDKVTIAMPNSPMGVIIFYALNKIGAIANMIHPLSSQGEYEFYLNFSKSVALLCLDQFYGKVKAIRNNCPNLKYVIVASIKDGLPSYMKIPYALTLGRKIQKIDKNENIIRYKDLISSSKKVGGMVFPKVSSDDVAAILYSGGTTGTTKGILLTNKNFNALSSQILEFVKSYRVGDVFLAVMPIFHGFGLGIAIHTMFSQGGHVVLVPRFTPDSYAKLIKKSHPNFIAGVPSLYEAMLRTDSMQKADLSSLKGIFSGGDSLSIELKKKLDKFLKEHNSKVTVKEGYGMTECVTASCITPTRLEKEGSIGIPLPDMIYRICKPGTDEELPFNVQGEICIAGPTVMKGYLDNEEETKQTLIKHRDGLTYIHSGDIGYMDEDGYIYFVQRLKRMIVSNGYNIYPSQLENIIDKNEYVHMSCVIGVKDPIKVQKVKAFIMLKKGIEPSEKIKKEIFEYLKKYIAKYSMPYDIEFRETLPTTLVGKVAYRKLEEEEEAKQK